MHNVEFKAELRDPVLARAIAERAGARRVAVLEQTDTYFRVPHGRLKMRETVADGATEPVEYIFYDRPDRSQPKLSHFTIYTESEARERFGARPLPVWIVVRKRREVWVRAHVRIHLDEVRDLGAFLEFEALVTGSQSATAARAENEKLRQTFAPALGEPISTSYSDLLAPDRDTTRSEDPR